MNQQNSRPSILIVDDEPINLQRAAQTLHKQYQLHLAKSGLEALEFLEFGQVDLILLDIDMPEMDGFEVATRLKEKNATASIPLIFLTGDDSEETIEKAFGLGVVDYVTKPFRDKELNARIKNRIETELLKQKLHAMNTSQQHLLEIINDYVFYLKTDLTGIITKVSSAFVETLGCDEKTLLNQSIQILKSGHTPSSVYSKLWETLKKNQVFSDEIENRNFKGGTNWYRVLIKPDIEDNQLVGYVAFYTNIDSEVGYQQQAISDYLTGLVNRAKFEQEITQEIYRANRYDTPLSLLMIDIDHFKRVNDTYGHDAGDSVLVEFSQLLKKHTRQSDICARWGGEEFVIMCPNTNLESAISLAELLRKTISTNVFKTVGHCTASFGVVQLLKDSDLKTLFSDVDQSLYKAKNHGRDCVRSIQTDECL